MKLNIYVISHPIIQILNDSNHKNNIIKFNKIKDEPIIILFVIYEILRKLIKINTIYIHKLNYIHNISIMDSTQTNYIITDIINNHYLLRETYDKFPQTDIIHCDIKNKNYNDNLIKKITNLNDITNIIILEKFIEEDSIINILQYITSNIKIKEKQITIACITCTHQVLEKISQYYNDINLYTTNIIKTN